MHVQDSDPYDSEGGFEASGFTLPHEHGGKVFEHDVVLFQDCIAKLWVTYSFTLTGRRMEHELWLTRGWPSGTAA